MRRARILNFACLLLAACAGSGDFPKSTSLVPAGHLRLAPNYAIAFSDVVTIGLLVGAVYVITDPADPTWKLIETRLPDDRVRFRLEKQVLNIGGDGESRYLIVQRLADLAAEQGRSGYRLDRYEESIDNRILFPRRLAYAEATLTGGDANR